MKRSGYLLAWAFALIVTIGGVLSAQEPARGGGKVLVLDNGNVLEGEVQRQGDMYIVHRPLGELKVPVAKTATVCASLEDAFKFLAGRANLRDGDERLQLARWCQTHGLRDQAIAEARASLQMRPGHAESKQLLAILEQVKTPAAPPAPVEKAVAPVEAAALLEVTSDCLALFTNKVQPILMNTCANCHANGKGGAFVLRRSSEAGGQLTTQLNLTAAIKQLSFDQPNASPLLHKACSAHGGAAQAALANREAVPFVTLQSWAEMVVSRNPHLKSHGAAASAAGPLPTPTPVAYVPGSPNTVEQMIANEKPVPSAPTNIAATASARPVEIDLSPAPTIPIAARPVAIEETPFAPGGPGTPGTPRPLTEGAGAQPASEFDPMIFNRMWHLER